MNNLSKEVLSNPSVSVVMPAYNAELYIEQAIRSILEQSFVDFELIISDDASEDKTVACITRFKDERITLLRQRSNTGYVNNMNTLLKSAKGKFIVIQDADDYSHKDRLQLLHDFLERHQEIGLVGSSYIKKTIGKEELVQMPSESKNIHALFDAMQYPLPILNGTVMFRRSIIDAGILYRDLKYVNRAQDDDWLFRVSEKYGLSNINTGLYFYRTNSSSMTLNPKYFNYYSLFAGDYVRFLKKNRQERGIDLLEHKKWDEINAFFETKKNQLKKNNPAYIESYIAHKYLAKGDRMNTLKWLLKAILKAPLNFFFWKKMLYVSVRKSLIL